MLKEFKEFITKGDVLDLAVGVVIGSAFTAIINKIVEGLITPLVALFISLFTNGKDLQEATSILDYSPVKGVKFAFGDVITAIITFILTGFVLFLVVKAANRAKNLRKKTETEEVIEETPAVEIYLSEIRDLLEKQTANETATRENLPKE
ncbi:large conductance mechanosensitive channel protein [Enterococcus phoeniculicola]|uniref:Large-conductance mechanosensitive channel n=1 Tax=Enterococcus phoeniculicola ATCC BAA-412 TaxID=1158610 RepID=R3U751_9ENTE|nr:large conductance mechanosensitive channel protein MscL [Enterococcus phoeniculicola]EOL49288.1 large conductance mechanosensitive channel protein [Enterococcus phoeniculicola ATCC BAA-412]EOT71294.1 large conductance mechanosensitive channel protein [Enterococcus phoeniculicola ATCC BAA-412]OJG70230.1 large conductance mechanosensitive channel protein [Enterococcus phoeniculicola]